MLHSFSFSPTGTSLEVADLIAKRLTDDCRHADITLSKPSAEISDADDMVLFAAPVYAGRIPPMAAERFSRIKGHGQKAIAIAVYGNRDYDDALIELADILRCQGFDVVAAGAFIARHCIFPKVAAGRPDKDDELKIAEFAEDVKRAVASGSSLDLDTVKGNRPYKKASAVPLRPHADSSKCNACGKCADECPAGAIDRDNILTSDKERCIACCRCIYTCPQGARSFDSLIYKAAAWKFVRDNSRRLEPEWFV